MVLLSADSGRADIWFGLDIPPVLTAVGAGQKARALTYALVADVLGLQRVWDWQCGRQCISPIERDRYAACFFEILMAVILLRLIDV